MAPRYCLIIFVMTIALVVLSPRIARISKVAHLFLLVITQYHAESYGAHANPTLRAPLKIGLTKSRDEIN